MKIGALLDTGSEISIITLALAKRMKILFKGDSQWTAISGIGGNTIASYTYIDTVLTFVGETEAANPEMSVRLNVVNKGADESLTLGVDVLSRYNLLLDYRANFGPKPAITTDPAYHQPDSTPVRAPLYTMCTRNIPQGCLFNTISRKYCPFISVTVEDDQQPFWALCDSGAQPSVIDLGIIKKLNLLHKIRKTKNCTVQGVAGPPVAVQGTIRLNLRLPRSGKTIKCEFLVIDESKTELILGMKSLSQHNLYVRHPTDSLTNNQGIQEPLQYPDIDPSFQNRQAHFARSLKKAKFLTRRAIRSAQQYLRKCRRRHQRPSRRRINQLQRSKAIDDLLHTFRRDKALFQRKQESLHLPVWLEKSNCFHKASPATSLPSQTEESFLPNIDPSALSGNPNTQDSEKTELPDKLSQVWKLFTRKKLKIPASSESTIWITLPPTMVQHFESKPAVLEPVSKELGPLMVATQLVSVSRKIRIKILNLDQTELMIEKNSLLGYLTVLPIDHILGTIPETDSNQAKVREIWCRSVSESEEVSADQVPEEINKLYQTHEWLKELDISDKINERQKLQLLLLVVRYEEAFSTSKYDLGLTTELEFEIPTTNQAPITVPPYRLPYQKKQILREILPEMISAGIIEPSTSNYNNPIVLVRKTNGDHRLCLDMRRLNEVTVPANMPIPNVSECMDILRGKNYFSSLDLNAAYHQIPIKQEHRHKTAFVANNRKYQFRSMLFGARSAPFYFAYLMEKVLGTMNFLKLLVYLDDILIFSKSFETHLHRIEETLQRLKSANLKLKPSKCSLAHSQTRFLGFIVSRNGIIPNPVKVMAITQVTSPSNVKELQRFLGLLNYYSRFIQNWQRTALPLTELLKKGTSFAWTRECELAFNILKDQLCNSPVMKGPDFQKTFILSCDASLSSAGATLSQEDDDGHEHVIAYFSKKFTSTEYRYGASDKELLAMLRAIEFFKPYLWGRCFTVRTDCKALTHFRNLKVTSARHARWRTILGEYSFEVKHIPGTSNVEADFLSRTPQNAWRCDIFHNQKTVIYLSKEVKLPEVQPWRNEVIRALQIEDVRNNDGPLGTNETPGESLCTVISSLLTGKGNDGKQLRKKLQEYLHKHRSFYRENYNASIMNESEEYHSFRKVPKSITLTAMASLIKIPIIVTSPRGNRIFLPLTETTIDTLPPLGSVVILREINEDRYHWMNREFNNILQEELVEKILDGAESTGPEDEVEPWVVDQEKLLKKEGFTDLPRREKDVRALKITYRDSHPEPTVPDQSSGTAYDEDLGNRQLWCGKAVKQNPETSLHTLPNNKDVVALQDQDRYCSAWKRYIQTGDQPYFGEKHTHRYKDNMKINPEGILVYSKKRTRSTNNSEAGVLTVLPLGMSNLVLSLAHDNHGHFGIGKTVRLLSDRYFRFKPSIKKITEDYIKGCLPCHSKTGAPNPKLAEVQENFIPTDRFTAWSIDHVKICRSHQGNEYILTMSDLYSRYTMFWPVPDTSVKYAIEAVMINIIRLFGVPDVLLSDRGAAFTSEVYDGVARLLQIKIKRTTALHPATNGLVERCNRSLGDMLRTATLADNAEWEKVLPIITLAYNSSFNRIIEDSPSYIMFGKDPKIPLDLVIQRPIQHRYALGEGGARSEVGELQVLMQRVREVTLERIKKNLETGRRQTNKNRSTRQFAVGDKVLLKIPQKKGMKKKFHLRYQGVYRVEKIINKVNLEIRSVTGRGKTQVIHQNRVIRYDAEPKGEILKWSAHYEDYVNQHTDEPSGNIREEEADWIDLLN